MSWGDDWQSRVAGLSDLRELSDDLTHTLAAIAEASSSIPAMQIRFRIEFIKKVLETYRLRALQLEDEAETSDG